MTMLRKGWGRLLPTRKASSRVRAARTKKTSPERSSAVLKLVRAGVKRFVLQDAPIATFQKAVREASRAGRLSSHPLSGEEFRRIVKEAVEERKRILARRLKRKRIEQKGTSS